MQKQQGWLSHKTLPKKTKDYGIIKAKMSFSLLLDLMKIYPHFDFQPSALIPFPFVFFITLAKKSILNFIICQYIPVLQFSHLSLNVLVVRLTVALQFQLGLLRFSVLFASVSLVGPLSLALGSTIFLAVAFCGFIPEARVTFALYPFRVQCNGFCFVWYIRTR